MAYMTSNFKGKYRLKTPYDLSTNQFPRDNKGNFSDLDIYIDCLNGIKVSYFGHSKLEAYIPSLGRGRNIVKAIYSDFVEPFEKSKYFPYDYECLYKDERLNKIIFHVYDTDEEVLFRFKASDMDKLEKYLKPRTSGASISPFSSKNLPRNKEFKIPDDKLVHYKEIVANLPKERMMKLSHATKNFLKGLATKKNTYEDIKNDMALKCLKSKEYIYVIGKWDEYISYMRKELSNND